MKPYFPPPASLTDSYIVIRRDRANSQHLWSFFLFHYNRICFYLIQKGLGIKKGVLFFVNILKGYLEKSSTCQSCHRELVPKLSQFFSFDSQLHSFSK